MLMKGHKLPELIFKKAQSFGKVVANMFWDRKKVSFTELMTYYTTLNANRYCETLKKHRQAIQNWRRRMIE